jgi:hypothetical protein
MGLELAIASLSPRLDYNRPVLPNEALVRALVPSKWFFAHLAHRACRIGDHCFDLR